MEAEGAKEGRFLAIDVESGADEIYDAGGRNTIEGGPGDDYVYGRGRLVGGKGDDTLRGDSDSSQAEPRVFVGGAGQDRVYSRRDTNDTIYVSDGERDTVANCGGPRTRSTSTKT